MAIDMENGPWFTEGWLTSPLNFLPEVRAGLDLPPRLQFHDAMLRDGEQTPGVVLLKEHKVAIAKGLDEVGVDRIEAGMPAVSEEDFEAIKLINQLGLKAKVSGFVRAMPKDVDLCLKTGVSHLVIEIPCGYLRLKYQMGWTEDECIRRAVEAVSDAKKQGVGVCFFPFDATRAEPSFYERLVKTVYEEAHPDSIAVVDTMGTAIPQAIAYMVRRVRSIVDVPVEVHTHNDFGMGVAGTMAAVSAGAQVAHVCINGMGERTGNAALEEVAMCAKIMYGMEVNINFSKLLELSALVQELTGVRLDKLKPVVGENAYAREVGLGMDMVRKQPRTVFPADPVKVLGRTPKVVLGKKSGILSIGMKLEEWGLTASEEQMREMVDRVKRLGTEKRRPVEDDELRKIYEDVVNG